VQRQDEVELGQFLHALPDDGVHIVCAAGPAAIAAAAILGKALKRGDVPLAGLTVVSYGERVDAPAWRGWFGAAPALLVIGLGVTRPLAGNVPQLAVDFRPGAPPETGDDEPLAARAFRLAESIARVGDASWCAAVGLLPGSPSHALVELALGRYDRAELGSISELLDAAARGPAPSSESLIAADMLIAVPDPHRFSASLAAEALRRTQLLVRSELVRAASIRPQAGFGVVVVEYSSACSVEDLVAARWRGLRPGTAVLVANHGAVDGMVAVTARAAVPEALERLRPALGEEGRALLTPESWRELRARLGVADSGVERRAGSAASLLN
jgi:hypothetical protein